MITRFLALLGLVLLSACAEPVWAPEEEVQRALYRADGPSKLTLFTVENTHNGSGAHSALMVSGPHRALFDPAGTFRHPHAPERNDVLFGMTPTVLKVYIDYHARETFNVRIQEIEVSPQVAARALQLIQDNGPVAKAHCNVAVTGILSQLPGFENRASRLLPETNRRMDDRLPRRLGTARHR